MLTGRHTKRARFRQHAQSDDDSFHTVEAIADFPGRPAPTRDYRRGGVWIHVPVRIDWNPEEEPERKERSMLKYLWRRLSALMARYRMAGLTPKQLGTIEALMLNGKGLHEFAREEGVSAQAVEARIESLKYKAPEFYRWWRKHGSRGERICLTERPEDLR